MKSIHLLGVVTCALLSLASLAAEVKGSKKVWKEEMQRGQKAYEASRYPEALEHYQRALQEAEAIQSKDHTELAGSLKALGEFYANLEQYPEAVQALKRAAELYEGAKGPFLLNQAENLWLLGQVCRYSKDYALAETSLKRALEIVELRVGKFHPLAGLAVSSLAEVSAAQAKYEEAERQYQEAFALLTSTKHTVVKGAFGEMEHHVLKPVPKLKAEVLNGWGNLYADQKKYSQAEEKFLESIKAFESDLGKNVVDLHAPLRNLALVKLAQNDKDSAEKYLLREMSIEKRAPGGLKWMASTLAILAEVYYEEKREDGVAQMLREALELQRRLKQEVVAALVDQVVREDIRKRQFDRVEKMQRQALALLEKEFGQESKETASMLDKLSSTLGNMNRTQEAEDFYTRSLRIRARQ